jgi:hypothetical protein
VRRDIRGWRGIRVRMSDCVESGRGDDSRGVGAVKAQSMVDGTRGGIGAHSLSCGSNRS